VNSYSKFAIAYTYIPDSKDTGEDEPDEGIHEVLTITETAVVKCMFQEAKDRGLLASINPVAKYLLLKSRSMQMVFLQRYPMVKKELLLTVFLGNYGGAAGALPPANRGIRLLVLN
jgi:hypothetical protein